MLPRTRTRVFSRDPVVVIDLNGILADIRRKESPPNNDRRPDVVLPNGQKAYLNPGWRRFLRGVLMIPRVKVVLYTSRLKKNSEPVERLLMPELMCVTALLHGENCLKPSSDYGRERFHPTKSVDKVCEAVGCKSGDVVFIDDNPHRIVLESSDGGVAQVVRVSTYDSLVPDGHDARPPLDTAIFDLVEILNRTHV